MAQSHTFPAASSRVCSHHSCAPAGPDRDTTAQHPAARHTP